jgi:hypothetical protein
MSWKTVAEKLTRFQGVEPKELTDPPKEKQPTATYLVGMSSCFSLGLTLAEAILIALLEPTFACDDMAQVFSRHVRFGNKMVATQCILLVAKESLTEQRIELVNGMREKIQETVRGRVGESAENRAIRLAEEARMEKAARARRRRERERQDEEDRARDEV